jgi:hypothetical protein
VRPPIVAVTPETESDEPEPEADPPASAKQTPPPAVEAHKPKPKQPDAPQKPEAPRPARPRPKPTKQPMPDPHAVDRERALESLRVSFVAKQHIVYKTNDGTKESTGILTVYPGSGYRLKITGPLGIVALDLQVRCNKYSYHVPLKLKHLRGPLSQAIKDIPYFPIAAIFSMFDPNLAGAWHGRTFEASAQRLRAKVHKSLPAFVEWTVIDGNDQPMVMRIAAFQRFDDGALLPQKFHVDFSDGRKIELEAESVDRMPPPESKALDAITCD